MIVKNKKKPLNVEGLYVAYAYAFAFTLPVQVLKPP